jgi:hypothetical protein
MDISTAKETIRTVRFDFLGHKEHAKYKLGALSVGLTDFMNERANGHGTLPAWTEYVVTEWSLTANGEPILPTIEQIEHFGIPTPYLRAVHDAVYDDADPKALRATSTSSG